MTTKRVLADYRLNALSKPIKAAAHVGCHACEPYPRTRYTIQRLQARQADHDSYSITESRRRRWPASNPEVTIKLHLRRWRSSIPADCAVSQTAGSGVSEGTTSTARKGVASARRKRFFQS